jgi:hypothetical protein
MRSDDDLYSKVAVKANAAAAEADKKAFRKASKGVYRMAAAMAAFAMIAGVGAYGLTQDWFGLAPVAPQPYQSQQPDCYPIETTVLLPSSSGADNPPANDTAPLTEEQATAIARERLFLEDIENWDRRAPLTSTCAGESIVSGRFNFEELDIFTATLRDAVNIESGEAVPVWSFLWYIDLEEPFDGLGIGLSMFICIDAFSGETFSWNDELDKPLFTTEDNLFECHAPRHNPRTLSEILDELYPDRGGCACAGQPNRCPPIGETRSSHIE